LTVKPTTQLSYLKKAIDDELLRRESLKSLHTFMRRYWHIVEPGTEFIDNWHIRVICEHLEAVTAGKIKRLVINVPFRMAKSTIVSVMWPAWVWAQNPSHQWLCGSYAEKLALRDNLKMRRLINSPMYQREFGDVFRLTSDQNTKLRFENDKAGYRIAFGTLSGVMGDGGNTLLLDDPHDRRSANSDTEREDAITTYDEALVSRLNQPSKDSIVIIMQRLHHLDLSGHVLKQPGWDHLMLPMEFETQRVCTTSIGFKDPRTKEGELLFPARFPRATVESLKTTLGEYGTAGQLQQRPSPDGGGILQTGHFQLWPVNKPLPIISYVVQSYDTAYTEDTQNDPTACTVWGIFSMMDIKTKKMKNYALLMDAWTEHMAYPQLRPRIIKDWNQQYGGEKKDPLNNPRKPDTVILEEKGSGISLIQDLRQARVPVVPYNPGRASKVTRAHLSAPLLETDVFYILESTKEPGKPVMWARELLTQMEQFPAGEHDDYVDTFTQAAIYLQRTEHLSLPKVPEEPVEERDYYKEKRKRRNPYAA
jgi:predicted phage terminase large subunit-like protein